MTDESTPLNPPLNHPAKLELEPGKYAWCACGKSSKRPFCDGSHQGSSVTPVIFELEEKQTVALCQCYRSGNGHRCDGSHKSL